jgi:hypothetical protein
MNIPNFFIVGAVKSGTTSLYHYLQEHPDIYMCPIKEPHYFSKDIDPKKFNENYKKTIYIDLKKYFNKPILVRKSIAFIERWEDYVKLFREAENEKVIGEASNGYLYSKVAAKNIRKRIPNAKIIIILRNPIERAFSHFIMDIRDGRQKEKDFSSAVLNDINSNIKGWGITNLYIELGLYSGQVKRWLNTFPKENIRIFLFDELKENPINLVINILKFLEVDDSVYINTERKYNIVSVPRFQRINNFFTKSGIRNFFSNLLSDKMKQNIRRFWFGNKSIVKLNNQARELLLPYFEDDIKKLERIIDRDLSGWFKT